MQKISLLIIILFTTMYKLHANDCSNIKDFNPSLLSEVYFNTSNIVEIDKISYIVYDGKIYKNIYDKDIKIRYSFGYNDNCINFSKKSENVLKHLPDGCFVEIVMSCNDGSVNSGGMADIRWQYMCNNKVCKKTTIIDEGLLFDYEAGEDVSEQMFNTEKTYNGKDFFDKVIKID